MEEKKINIAGITFGYGVMISIGMIVYDLVLYLLDLKLHPFLPYFSYIILFAGILLASISFRNKYLGGMITYGKAFNTGFLAALFASVILAVYAFVFLTFIDPGAMEEAMALVEEKVIGKGLSDAEIEQALSISAKFQSPWISALASLAGNVIIGLILALITSIFVKHEDKAGQAAA